MKSLVPGRRLRMEFGEVEVFPAGAVHARKLMLRVLPVVNMLAAALLPRKGESGDQHGLRMSADLVPMMVEHAWDIIDECVVLPKKATLDQVPHWCLPPIVEAWIEESFGTEEKRRPWIALVESLVTRLNGGVPIPIGEMISKLSSKLESLSKPSSSSDSQASPTGG